MAALLLALAALASAGPNKAALDALFDGQRLRPNAVAAPAAQKNEVLELLLEAHRANEAAPVWPGYSILAQPILLYQPGQGAHLIAHPAPPADFAPVPGVAEGLAYRPGDIPDLQFSFDFHRQINGHDSFAYRLGGSETPQRTMRVIVHERFHVFQEKSFQRETGEPPLEDPTADMLASAALEQRLLARALRAGPAERADLARQFTAVRRARHAAIPDLREREAQEERSEGMARYVDLRVAALLRHGPDPAPQVEQRLARFPDLSDISKGRAYDVGAAQGLLLDAAGFPDWKKAVAGGEAPGDLLARAWPVDPADEAALVAQAKNENGWAALLAKGQAVAGAHAGLKAKAQAAYDSSPGPEFDAPMWLGPGTGIGFQADDGFRAGEWMLYEKAVIVEARAAGFELVVRDRPVMMGSRLRFHADSPVITLDGAPYAPAQGDKAFSTLELSAPGVTLKLQRPGRLKLDSGRVVIEVTSR